MATSITYQGQLKHEGVPVDGPADFIFVVWSAETGGSALASVGPVTLELTDGLFATPLDFGDTVFTGAARWLEVRVRFTGTWRSLSPRQRITATPYADGGAG
jgi:hypothetical protein